MATTVCCKCKIETANFSLYNANGKGKLKFVFFDLETINGNQRLLFQQTCPSMLVCMKRNLVWILINLWCKYFVPYLFMHCMYYQQCFFAQGGDIPSSLLRWSEGWLLLIVKNGLTTKCLVPILFRDILKQYLHCYSITFQT
jgi:hypothetical protein